LLEMCEEVSEASAVTMVTAPNVEVPEELVHYDRGGLH